jgi:hypothetical protein
MGERMWREICRFFVLRTIEPRAASAIALAPESSAPVSIWLGGWEISGSWQEADDPRGSTNSTDNGLDAMRSKLLDYSPGCAPSYVIEEINEEKRMREENHTIMCLKAEITARNAANVKLREERDHLEEGLREAKAQLVALQARINALEFPHDAESDPAEPGKNDVAV